MTRWEEIISRLNKLSLWGEWKLDSYLDFGWPPNRRSALPQRIMVRVEYVVPETRTAIRVTHPVDCDLAPDRMEQQLRSIVIQSATKMLIEFHRLTDQGSVHERRQ